MPTPPPPQGEAAWGEPCTIYQDASTRTPQKNPPRCVSHTGRRLFTKKTLQRTRSHYMTRETPFFLRPSRIEATSLKRLVRIMAAMT